LWNLLDTKEEASMTPSNYVIFINERHVKLKEV